MGERIPTEKAINFGKSSGGREKASHSRKLDTSKGISEKNYVQEKSFPYSKTITRAEFQRRKTLFERWCEKANEGRGGKAKTWTVAHEGKKRSDSFHRKFRSLENLSGAECRAKELEMSRKLKEIHELVQEMEKAAKMKEKKSGKAFSGKNEETRKNSEWRSKVWEYSTGNRAQGPSTFESRCNLNRKLVPIQFSTSFVTELGSRRKSFFEKILFKSLFILSGDERARKVFRSTLEITYGPETEMEMKKAFVFL